MDSLIFYRRFCAFIIAASCQENAEPPIAIEGLGHLTVLVGFQFFLYRGSIIDYNFIGFQNINIYIYISP